ncbi:MAG: MBL fold metallo-hydrolase [Spirochaetales bacterium]|nr:MBL fold metallo-hydrolase [Spirochaetales bacterium]
MKRLILGILVIMSISALGSCFIFGPSGVKLCYEENAQFELTSPEGTRVLIDVYDPALLSRPATEKDVLLTTHSHTDHYNNNFVESFKGTKIMMREAELTLPDVRIRSIASAHNANLPLLPEGGSNYIFVIDMGGLRIVHFGDIGQDALNPQQLEIIGKVDIAISQLANNFSSMSFYNKKGFNLMDQVKPRLLLPTHIDLNSAMFANEKYSCTCSDAPAVIVNEARLDKDLKKDKETSCLFLGKRAPDFKALMNLEKIGW